MSESHGSEAPACPLRQPSTMATSVLHGGATEIPPSERWDFQDLKKNWEGDNFSPSQGKAVNSELYCDVEGALLLMTAKLGGLSLKNPY